MKSIWGKFFLLIALLAGKPLLAQDSLYINHIQPYIRHDTLMISLSSSGLFTGAIKRTLLSGMPVLVELKPRLIYSGGQSQVIIPVKIQFSYDIWENRFNVKGDKGTRFFTSLKKLIYWWNSIQNYSLLPTIKTYQNQSLQIAWRFRVFLLANPQSQKLKQRIFPLKQNKKKLSHSKRTATFTFNLNHVISFFFHQDNSLKMFEVNAISAPFLLNDL